jgi:simple sugar transport system ATP-binding protein
MYVREYLYFMAGVHKIEEPGEAVERVIQLTGLTREAHKKNGQLSKGYKQRVGLAAALVHNPPVLILDEPTAVLTPQETDELLNMMKILKSKGTSIIFITHKLREVKAVADQIAVIRRGKVVGTIAPSTSQEELASLMVGRAVDLEVNKVSSAQGATILKIDNLNIYDGFGRAIVSKLSIDIKAGEILAIAGVQGNGQSEIARAIMNLEPHVSGSVKVDGSEILGSTVHESIESGIAFIPESRELDGLIGSFSIAENLILNIHNSKPFAKSGQLSKNAIVKNANDRVKEFDIRTQSIDDSANSLSGGNKQKVVLARELSRSVKIVIASQPTRGLDVGSIEFVHERLLAERASGRAILLISTELDEVIALADRIAVIYRGEILGIVDPSVTREKLGLMMAGVK